MKVCFVHKGNPSFLSIAAAQAASIGLEPVIIGDETSYCESYELIDIGRFDASMEKFRSNYRHISVNPYSYELFCYERWYAVRDYIAETGQAVLMIDHDVLLYPRILESLDMLKKCYDGRTMIADTAWLIYLPDISAVDMVISRFENIFSDEVELMALANRNAINGVPHISDMHIFFDLIQRKPEAFLQLSSIGPRIGLDNNIRLTQDFVAKNDHKVIDWHDNRPYARTVDGTVVEMASLHFQGPSKFLMDLYHTVVNPVNAERLPDFSAAVDSLPSDPLGLSIKHQRELLVSAGRQTKIEGE